MSSSQERGNEPDAHGQEPSSAFPQTSLTLYQRIVSGDPDVSRKALGEFFQRYWYPLYALMRSRGENQHNAADLVQGFITDQVLQREQVRNWEPEKGRLRTFLKVAIERYRVSEHRRASAVKRGGDHTQTHVSMDFAWAEGRYAYTAIDHDSPDRIFDREWAEATIQRAITLVATDYQKRERFEEFQLLSQNLSFRSGEGDPVTFRDIAARLGTTEANVKQKMSAFRQRFRSALITVTAQTVGSLEVADEVDFISELLLGSR